MKKCALVTCLAGVFALLAVTLAMASVTEITMWFGRQDFIPADNFETFHAENPDIRVTTDVIPLEQALAAYARSYQARRAPDILQINHHQVPQLAMQQTLADITPILEWWEAEYPEDFADMAPAAWSMPSHEGISYGMTLHAAPYWFVYRKDLFAEAGLEPPETWDDVLEAGRILRADNMIGFSVIGSRTHNPNWFQAKFMTMGGYYVDNVPQLDSPAGIYLLSFYQTLMRDNIAHPDTLAWDSGPGSVI